MRKISCAQYIAEFFVNHGIRYVFDMAGGMIANIEDAVSKTPNIDCYPEHHEQACGFSAEGYARVSENFGVAMATSGPGATNLITAIGSCYFDSTPTFFITGQVNTAEIKKHQKIRQIGFQETDIVSIVKPITKYAKQILDPEDIRCEMEKALFIMKQGRSGPVLLDIPFNIQTSLIDADDVRTFFNTSDYTALAMEKVDSALTTKKMQELERLLNKARSPIVLVGGGVRLSQTSDALRDFVQRNNLPVVVSLMGLDSYMSDDPNFVGFIGSYGNRDANMVLANADLVIALGTRLDIKQTGDPALFSSNKSVVHVDIDEYSIDASVPSELSFHIDLNTFFEFAAQLTTPKKEHWFSFMTSVASSFARLPQYNESIDPNTFMLELSRESMEGSIVVADVGQHQMWLAQSWQCKKGQRVLFSGGMGSMGFALPTAIGAYCARPTQPVIVVCGDGGFQLNIQELETVRYHNIPLKIFVINNNNLGMVREFQDYYFDKNYQSTIIGYSCPDLKKIAYAYDMQYEKIETITPNDERIKDILNVDGPVLIEVSIDTFAKLEPKVIYGKSLEEQFPELEDVKKQEYLRYKEAFISGNKL